VHVVGGDDFDAERFDFVECGDDDFFGEPGAVECEAQLDSTIDERFMDNELFECAHYPGWKEIHVDFERIPGFKTRSWAVAEYGADAGGEGGCYCCFAVFGRVVEMRVVDNGCCSHIETLETAS